VGIALSRNDSPKVILVDESDRQVGLDDKLHAHQNGAKLHRAFSVFVFNKKGETLLQQRAMTKYHTKGKWTNACCSHPMPGESVEAAAHRRLQEEMGFDCELREVFSFVYKADVGEGLTEHEYDHVFFGNYDDKVEANEEEAMGYKWVSLERLKGDIRRNPDNFTPWLKMSLDRVASTIKKRK
jgi:isopentenyl-diphosphate delta-isomerase